MPRGHLTQRKVRGGSGADARITRITYWPTGLVKKITQPDGSTITYHYDAAQRLVTIRDSAGNRIHYTLDNAGNRIREDTRGPHRRAHAPPDAPLQHSGGRSPAVPRHGATACRPNAGLRCFVQG